MKVEVTKIPTKRNVASQEAPNLAGVGAGIRDVEYISTEDTGETPERLGDEWQVLEGFEDSALFAAFFDENINSGKVRLHPWQVEEPERICGARPNSKHPYKYCLCAANGSGKDAFVIAPLALWFICTKKRSQVIITSASGVQLSNQTEAYIAILAEKINAYTMQLIGAPILKVRKRQITCLLSGSRIVLFATDEEGKAEGYHPLEPDAEMMIIVNEAKSVAPEIFRALRRCTGYNYWINVSTPGEPIGDFYNSFKNWPNKRRITYYDCPHQSPDEFEADKLELGEHSPLFRSKWLAEFSFVGGKTVVNEGALARTREMIIAKQIKHINTKKELRVGLDIALSKNGDESVVSIWQGNKQLKQLTYRVQDATILADKLEVDWAINRVGKTGSFIYADDGGVGRPVIDILRRRGWNIHRVLNQSAPKNKKQFRNRGAEMWYKFARMIEAHGLIFLDDEKLFEQIKSRKYLDSGGSSMDRLTLQSKKDMIAEGKPSPDRADAAVLALCDIRLEEFYTGMAIDDSKTKPKSGMTPEAITNRLWDGYIEEGSRKKKHSRFSLNALVRGGRKLIKG